MPGCIFCIEICEDLWAVQPPSGNMALAGANVILNPSASDEVLGESGYRRAVVQQQAARPAWRPICMQGAGPESRRRGVSGAATPLIARGWRHPRGNRAF